MDFRDITPLITAFGPVAAVIVVMDYVFRENQKAQLFNFFVRIAQVGSKPLSFGFYFVVTISSVLLTLGIISINGFIEILTKRSLHPTGVREATAAILIAVTFKILVWDYLLALKSYALLRGLGSRIQTKRGMRRAIATVPGLIAIFLDFFLTIILTERVFHWWQVFQSSHQDAVPPRLAEALGFFDAVNFMAKDTMQNSFYALNGTLIMYLAMGLSAAARGTVAHLNVKGITDNIFKIIASMGAFVVLVVAIARHVAEK
jgi:hypothetical protein